ncbi:MAG: DUF1295 domain-containing protein [Pseudomonadales bacterium]|nr:DUF1295 domain-containing protein [Pseudomonadales bacterium]
MIWVAGLAALLTLLNSVLAWRLSTRYQCASIADVFWPLHHLVSMTTVLLLMPQNLSAASLMTVILVVLWGVRLATHLSIRQAGVAEDPRYQAIRASVGADFDRKSLYLIFAPQALMAWFISLLLIPALTAAQWHPLAYVGLLLCSAGLLLEIVADLQLSAFLKERAVLGNSNPSVLDRGLWSFSRHPNYFGEWIFWLGHAITAALLINGFLIVSLAAMGLLTFLLLRFTGVARSEPGIADKRPDYAAYQANVPAFFPSPMKIWSTLTQSAHQAPNTKHQLGWWLLIFAVGLAGHTDVARAQDVPTQSWLFDVHIDDKDVGFHEFNLRQIPSGYTMEATAEFRYKILGVTVFSYEHAVKERYDADLCLQSISSETNTNGKSQSLSGLAVASGFALEARPANQAQTSVDANCLMTFAYWTPKLLSQSQILNGQTGELVDVVITPENSADKDQHFYALTGDKMDVRLGYDEAGNWRTLDSTLQNGRWLSYRLRQ